MQTEKRKNSFLDNSFFTENMGQNHPHNTNLDQWNKKKPQQLNSEAAEKPQDIHFPIFQTDHGHSLIAEHGVFESGGFAQVFKARSINGNDKENNANNNNIVAIKYYYSPSKNKKKKQVIAAKDQYSFEKEALLKLSVGKSHDNIIQMIATGPQFLVLEFISGNLFNTLVEQGPLEDSKLNQVLQELCSAVHHVHQHQLCHLDIKPENILLKFPLQVVLADFGCARPIPQNQLMIGSFGTVTYRAPEVSPFVAYSPIPCDIWSLACLYFTCFNGTPPFTNTTTCPYFKYVRNGNWDAFWEAHSHYSKRQPSEIEKYRFMEVLCIQPQLRPDMDYLISKVFT
mmetsp:Transcript_32042/g.37652  ORF Transcript_32042/g.37652 Transcript_32042/m.37652 type:complete len:341 (+) Transcript_32042:58-1080(+)